MLDLNSNANKEVKVENIEKVREFMVTFGQQTEYNYVPAEVAALRRSLIEEELGELEEAVDVKNIVEVADALADLEYVILGAMIVFGQVPFLPTFKTLEVLKIDGLIMSEGLDEMLDYLDLIDFSSTLIDQLSCVRYMANKFGVPLQHCFDEVHRSNMSKLGEDGKPIYREDGKVLKGPGYFKPDIAKVLRDHGV